jgi:hypothetical protein
MQDFELKYQAKSPNMEESAENMKHALPSPSDDAVEDAILLPPLLPVPPTSSEEANIGLAGDPS